MDVFKIITIFVASIGIAECYCHSTTLNASTSSLEKTVFSSSYDHCVINIVPSSSYGGSSNYYLRISWSSFGVNGEMPLCSRGHVQVYLTRSYKSIGKFCSANAAKPFTMYSHDGYARIAYKVDPSDSGYLTFKYELKSKSSEQLGASSTSCPIPNQSSHSSEVYSQYWPEKYSQSSSPCTHTIYRSSSYDVTKIIFMDLDLNASPYPGDCIELRGSNTSTSHWKHTIDTKICSTSSIKTYTVYDRYTQIKFNRRYGTSSYRGFLAGYVSYNIVKTYEPRPEIESSSSTSIISTVIRILGPAVVLGGGMFFFLKYRARMRAQNGNFLTGDIAVPMTHTNITATTTETTNTGINGEGTATNNPPSGYPKSTDPYVPPSHGSLSSVPYPNQSYPPPVYEFTANQTSDGTVLAYPCYPSGNLGYPTGNTGYPTSSSNYRTDNNTVSGSITLPSTSRDTKTLTTHGAQQQSIIPPIEQNNAFPNAPPTAYPNAPPPAYPNAPPPAYPNAPPPAYPNAPPQAYSSTHN